MNMPALPRGHLSAGKGIGGGFLKAVENADYLLHGLNSTPIVRFVAAGQPDHNPSVKRSEAAPTATKPPCVSMRAAPFGENRMLTHGGSVASTITARRPYRRITAGQAPTTRIVPSLIVLVWWQWGYDAVPIAENLQGIVEKRVTQSDRHCYNVKSIYYAPKAIRRQRRR
jgi:hypothetical protein